MEIESFAECCKEAEKFEELISDSNGNLELISRCRVRPRGSKSTYPVLYGGSGIPQIRLPKVKEGGDGTTTLDYEKLNYSTEPETFGDDSWNQSESPIVYRKVPLKQRGQTLKETIEAIKHEMDRGYVVDKNQIDTGKPGILRIGNIGFSPKLLRYVK